ncbi:CheR family methyltransferase [Prosthecobacter sp. SYSU 5D2]|uniref:CheR family methyltransferase n=1 Tax=Prosthecobacter sp. SYSU 5D2 TaxID=3134134 RepID=UPI0031FE9BAB
MRIAVDKPHELLSDPQFFLLKDWIIGRTGLSYYKERDVDLLLALERVFGPEGPLPGGGALLKRLKTDAEAQDALVEQLTIGETFFFRHAEMFTALRDAVFPDILRRKAGSRSLRIWSAGCSIGAEPYSLAILLREMLGEQFRNWSIQILGTDINRKFLRIAEAGAYDPWALRGTPPHVLHRCFTKQGAKWRLTDPCREGVTFQNHNLATDPFPDETRALSGFDLIICRNVMIYFDQPSIQKLARQFYDTLTPGGWLAVGHAEPHTDTFRMFRTVNTPGAVLYQRPVSPDEVAWTPPVLPVWFPSAEWQRQPEPPAPEVRLRSAELPLPKAPPLPAAPVQPAAGEGELAEITRHADAGDLHAALKACDRVLLQSPLSAGAHYYHGMILFQLGEWTAAEKSIHRCLYLARDLALAHYYMGLVQERQGRNARRHFENTLNLLAPHHPEDPVPLGQGLTVREFRSLLAVPESACATSIRA